MRVTVKLFGPERRVVNADAIDMDVADGATCAELRARLVDTHPAFADLSARFAVNQNFVDDDHVLSLGDEVALIGLVSGG